MFRMQFQDFSFYITYIVAVLFSFVGMLIVNKYRHRREAKRLKEKLDRLMKDESAIWSE